MYQFPTATGYFSTIKLKILKTLNVFCFFRIYKKIVEIPI